MQLKTLPQFADNCRVIGSLVFNEQQMVFISIGDTYLGWWSKNGLVSSYFSIILSDYQKQPTLESTYTWENEL